MGEQVDISTIILSWNTRELTQACLQAVKKAVDASDMGHEVIVIDNASSDGSLEMLEAEFPWVNLYRNDGNLGYAAGVNQGLRLARGDKITLLGSDTEIRPGTLETLAGFLDGHPGVGAVAPRLVNPDGSLQRACMRFPDLAVALWYDSPLEAIWPEGRVLREYRYEDWAHDENRSVEQPPATCLMLPREVVTQVGPMDRHMWLLFNDVDWCLRIRRAGHDIWYVHEGTEVLHHGGGSTRKYDAFSVEWHRNRLHFYRKHYHFLGTLIVKAAATYVGIREVFRIRRNLENTREFLSHAGQVLRAVGSVLIM